MRVLQQTSCLMTLNRFHRNLFSLCLMMKLGYSPRNSYNSTRRINHLCLLRCTRISATSITTKVILIWYSRRCGTINWRTWNIDSNDALYDSFRSNEMCNLCINWSWNCEGIKEEYSWEVRSNPLIFIKYSHDQWWYTKFSLESYYKEWF